MDGACPWCGEESGINPEKASCDKTMLARINQFDGWLEAHVAECPPYLAEQGINQAAFIIE